MPDRPTREPGYHLLASDDWNAVVDKAWHEHAPSNGISVGDLAASSSPGQRREWELAVLQGTLNAGSSASARLYRDPSNLTTYSTVNVLAPPTWADNDSMLADEWVVVLRHKPSVWYVLNKPASPPEAYFELKDALTPGATVTAYLRVDGVTDTDTEFEVKDVFGKYRGRAKGAFSSPNDRGSLGRAVLFRGVWEIRELEPHAMKIKALIDMSSGLLTTDPNITIDTVTITQPEGAILLDPTITEVTNVLSVAGDDDGIVFAEWNRNLGVFEGVPACPVSV